MKKILISTTPRQMTEEDAMLYGIPKHKMHLCTVIYESYYVEREPGEEEYRFYNKALMGSIKEEEVSISPDTTYRRKKRGRPTKQQ